MNDIAQIERDLTEFWRRYHVEPDQIRVRRELIEKLAAKRFGGGNSHQLRVWRRLWLRKQA